MSFYYIVNDVPACISDDVYHASLILLEQGRSAGKCAHRTAAEAQFAANAIQEVLPNVRIQVYEGSCPAQGDSNEDWEYIKWFNREVRDEQSNEND